MGTRTNIARSCALVAVVVSFIVCIIAISSDFGGVVSNRLVYVSTKLKYLTKWYLIKVRKNLFVQLLAAGVMMPSRSLN